MILVTGGNGFIGSNFLIEILKTKKSKVVNIDKVVSNENNILLKGFKRNNNYKFIKENIGNRNKIYNILKIYKPECIINFAAETHVDYSISNPNKTIKNNIIDTLKFYDEVLKYWSNLDKKMKNKLKIIQISTDEVYGSLKKGQKSFTEKSLIKPNNPYSASKASIENFLRSYYKTYGLPVIITRCSNNFGPGQKKDKFIPKSIICILKNKKIPLFGDGTQIRDWIYVSDHCKAIIKIIKKGKIGEIYNIGSSNLFQNKDLIKIIFNSTYKIKKINRKKNYLKSIAYTKDRLGHDRKYSINSNKIMGKLGWKPEESFKESLKRTIIWYMKHYSQ